MVRGQQPPPGRRRQKTEQGKGTGIKELVSVCPECGGVLTEDHWTDHAEVGDQPRSARRFRNQANDASDQANVVLEALSDAAEHALQSVADNADAAGREAAG